VKVRARVDPRPSGSSPCQKEAIPASLGRLDLSNRQEQAMRVMVIVKATKNSEAGKMPSSELLTAMGKFNEELVKAGIMLDGDGLKPSSKGKRVRFSHGSKRTVIDGPFAETKELVAGYWIWQVKSLDEAVEWVRRCPDPMPGEESELEIRPFYEPADFGPELMPDFRAYEERLEKGLDELRRFRAEAEGLQAKK
jgi:hypothetical protein